MSWICVARFNAVECSSKLKYIKVNVVFFRFKIEIYMNDISAFIPRLLRQSSTQIKMFVKNETRWNDTHFLAFECPRSSFPPWDYYMIQDNVASKCSNKCLIPLKIRCVLILTEISVCVHAHTRTQHCNTSTTIVLCQCQ